MYASKLKTLTLGTTNRCRRKTNEATTTTKARKTSGNAANDSDLFLFRDACGRATGRPGDRVHSKCYSSDSFIRASFIVKRTVARSDAKRREEHFLSLLCFHFSLFAHLVLNGIAIAHSKPRAGREKKRKKKKRLQHEFIKFVKFRVNRFRSLFAAKWRHAHTVNYYEYRILLLLLLIGSFVGGGHGGSGCLEKKSSTHDWCYRRTHTQLTDHPPTLVRMQ